MPRSVLRFGVVSPALVVGALAFACTSESSIAGGFPDDASTSDSPMAPDASSSDRDEDPNLVPDAAREAAPEDAFYKDANACATDAAVDDDPVCDQCVKASCCEWIQKCDATPSCKATKECIDACPPDDTACIVNCGAGGGTGGAFLQELGACVSNKCKTECAPDAG